MSVHVPHYVPGPSSVWGAEAGSSLGVTGCPMAVAPELAGRAIAARGAGLKAVWGLQARRAGTCPTLGVTGAVVATAAGLVTLWPPHSWGARCKGRRLEGVTRGLTPPQPPGLSVSQPHTEAYAPFGPKPTPHPGKGRWLQWWAMPWGLKHLFPGGGGTEGTAAFTSHSPLEQSSPRQACAHWH